MKWIKTVMHESTRTPEEVAHFAGPNAGYVIRCINMHEELLEVAKLARQLSPLSTQQTWAVALEALDKAIAKAEGNCQ